MGLQSGETYGLVVQPGAAHTMSFLSGAALSGSIVNARTTFEIQARDRYANLLTTGGDSFTFAFSCYSGTICKDATVVSELGDRNDGTYEASYLTDMQGKYLLEVNLAGEPVGIPPAKSPLLVSVKENSGEIDYRKTFLEGAAVSLAIAGAQNAFTIVALDRPNELIEGKSATGCWNAILKRVNNEILDRIEKGQDLPRPPKTAIAGPEYFGLIKPEVIAAIEAQDPERKCLKYWDGKEDREAYGEAENAYMQQLM